MMKKWSVLILLGSFLSGSVYSQKSILPDFYADPSAHAWDGQFWIYASHDIPGSKDWNMVDWHCFSSTDLVHWTDHGVIFSLADLRWAKQWAWAADCIKHNGKYYFYFTADEQIGVATSDSPSGPFQDALGRPLIGKGEAGTRAMDPAVFIDDDGQAYLYFGQNGLRVVKLGEDMTTRNGEIVKLKARYFHEGVWVHKKDGNYYLSYTSSRGDNVANLLEYSMGKTPFGPFAHKGVILDNRSRNVQGSIVQFGKQWYLFYHVQGPSPYERRVCSEYLYCNPDGTIRPIRMTREGTVLIR